MATGGLAKHNQDDSCLIVGFPRVPRQREESRRHHAVGTGTTDCVSSATIAITQSMMKRPRVKSVSFVATCELFWVPSKSKQELASAWYSEEEKTQFKKMVLRNAAEVMRMLETGPDYHHTEEELCKTIGMESFLNPRLRQISKNEKRRHAQTIIYAQARVDDPVILSGISERSSLSSRQSAHERALSWN